MHNPKLLRFLLAASLLALSGCFEESSSPSAPVPSKFEEWQPHASSEKFVLRAYPGKDGPMLLTLHGLLLGTPGPMLREISGTSKTQGLVNRFGLWGHNAFLTYQEPWVDSVVWIDAPVDQPWVSIEWTRHPGRSTNLLLEGCPDVPADLVAQARKFNRNILGGGANLRSGNFIFAYGGGLWDRSGYILLRFDPHGTPYGILPCGGFADRGEGLAIPTKWVPLNPATQSGWQIMHAYMISSIPTPGGILAYYEQSLADSTKSDYPGMYVKRLSFIDTNGVEIVLDSSNTLTKTETRFDYVKLLNFQGQSYAATLQGLVRIDAAAHSMQMVRGGDIFHPPFNSRNYGIAEVQDKMIIYGDHEILATDMTAWTVQHLSLAGLNGNYITGVVQTRDTVWVTTLSGIFFKPVETFFEAQ